MTQPTVAWNESIPGPQSPFSQGDDRIREVKKQIREIFEIDHEISSAGNGNEWGFHSQVTFNVRSAFPSTIASTGIFFTRDVSSVAELHFIDENATTQQLTSGGSFIGGMTNEIRMWSGLLANIPAGWILCDDTNGTINLTAKFIRGVATSSTAPGSTGGSDTGTIAAANIPVHTHSTVTSSSGGAHTHGYTHSLTGPNAAGFGTAVYYALTSYGSLTGSASANHDHGTVTTSSYGGATTFDNRPAYVELAFIKRS